MSESDQNVNKTDQPLPVEQSWREHEVQISGEVRTSYVIWGRLL